MGKRLKTLNFRRVKLTEEQRANLQKAFPTMKQGVDLVKQGSKYIIFPGSADTLANIYRNLKVVDEAELQQIFRGEKIYANRDFQNEKVTLAPHLEKGRKLPRKK